MAARGIGIEQVAEAVRRANVNLPTGTLYGANQAFTVQASGQLTHAEPYRSVIVTYRDGSPVRLGDHRRGLTTVSKTTRPRPGTSTSAQSSWPC